jgi:uncharacterized delta-60 repeat protein
MKFPSVALYLFANLLLISTAYSQLPSFRSGLIDRNFGEGGILTLGGTGSVERRPIAFFRASNGSIVNIHWGSGVGLGIFRYLPSGVPDPSFGNNGYAMVPNTSGFFPYAADMHADGSFVVVGSNVSNTGFDIVVAKVTEQGTLDQGFGTNGFISRDSSPKGALSDEEPSSVVKLSNGDILVAGIAAIRYTSAPVPRQLFLLRLSPTGELIASFGSEGLVTIPLGDGRVSPVGNVKITISSGGKLLVGVSAALGDDTNVTRFARVYRIESNGSLDTGFSDDGMVEISAENYYSGFYKILELANGKILCLSGPVQLTRLNSNGSFDETFGNSGKQTISSFVPNDLYVLPTGKFLITGATGYYPTERMGVVGRYWPDGTLDFRFGRSGFTRFGRPGYDFAFGPIFSVDSQTVTIGGAITNLIDPPRYIQPTLSQMQLGK